jgi:hypothetical protein
VSESESVVARLSQGGGLARAGADDILPPPSPRAVPEREGLPRNYRMRADSHYVDDLPPAAQPVIRMVPPSQIECRDLPPADAVEALTRSIGALGMLQPLLIRRQGRGYALIAGRKRLAASLAAGVAAVPCVLHDVDGQAAVALAAADNIRVDVASHAASDAGDYDIVGPLVQAVLADLTTIRTSTTLMKTTRQGSLTQQVGADLVDAHARRAAWLAACVAGSFENNRLVPLAAIIQRVCDAFDAQKTLTGMQLEWSVTPPAAIWMLPEEQATAVITGGVFAALASLEGMPSPRVEIHAESTQPRTLRIEIVQRLARVKPSGSEVDVSRPAELAAALALRAARMLASAHGGTADLMPLPGQGSVLQMTFATTS